MAPLNPTLNHRIGGGGQDGGGGGGLTEEALVSGRGSIKPSPADTPRRCRRVHDLAAAWQLSVR